MASPSNALSVVIPLRNEAANVAALAQELRSTLGESLLEALLVDDGSSDNTWALVLAECHADPRFRGVRLRRQSGKAAAYREGFNRCRGELIATLDGDLQDNPADLLPLRAAVEAGADLATGWKTDGKSSPTGFVISRLGNAMIRLFLRPQLKDMNCPVRVMRAEVARSLALSGDLHRFIPAIAHAAGFTCIVELPVSNRPRLQGSSKYSGTKYITGLAALVGLILASRFGRRPMAFFGSIGIPLLLLGVVIDAWFALRFVLFGSSVDPDLPTVVFGVLLILMGTQFLSLGFLAEMVARRLDAVEEQGTPLVAEER